MQKSFIYYRFALITLLQLVFIIGFASGADKNKLINLNSRAEEIMQDSPDEAIKILKQVIINSNEEEFTDIRAKALRLMGIVHYYQQNYRQSQEYFEQSLALYQKLEDKEGIAAISNNIGLIYERQGDYSQALKK